MIAIIPARGGSKGLPGKNIKELNGKPLIAYTIECALQSKYIDHVVVSTDDPKIAAISIKYGAEVPFLRPACLATDTSMAVDNYIYTIKRLTELYNITIDSFLVLQPTSPLRQVEDIDGAVSLFIDKMQIRLLVTLLRLILFFGINILILKINLLIYLTI